MKISKAGLDLKGADKLDGVHPDLVRVIETAHDLAPGSFAVTCGLRTEAEQRRLVEAGRSRTMHSRHLSGHAVDFVPLVNGQLKWDDPNRFRTCWGVFQKAAAEQNVPLEWGGDWKSFVDMPHLQLPRREYPEHDLTPRVLARRGSRIAGASQQQQADGAKAAAAQATPIALPAPPETLGIDGLAAKMGAAMGSAETIEKFMLFVWARGGWIAAALTAYWVARMAWQAGWIGRWRTEDQATGKTT